MPEDQKPLINLLAAIFDELVLINQRLAFVCNKLKEKDILTERDVDMMENFGNLLGFLNDENIIFLKEMFKKKEFKEILDFTKEQSLRNKP